MDSGFGLGVAAKADARCWAVRHLTRSPVRGGWAYPLIETVTVEAMECGPNSEQVEAYLQQVARLDADGWAALAQVLAEPAGLRERSPTSPFLTMKRAAHMTGEVPLGLPRWSGLAERPTTREPARIAMNRGLCLVVAAMEQAAEAA